MSNPWAFDTFPVPWRREFVYQSLPVGGEFDPHALGVKLSFPGLIFVQYKSKSINIWTAPSISCEISGVVSSHGGHGVGGFS